MKISILLFLAFVCPYLHAATYTAASCARSDVLAQVNTSIGGTNAGGGAVAGDTVKIPACSLDSKNISTMSRDSSNNVTTVLTATPDAQFSVGSTVCVVNSTIAGVPGGSTATHNGCYTVASTAGSCTTSGTTLCWVRTNGNGASTADSSVGYVIGCGTPNSPPSNCWSTMWTITGAINIVGSDAINPNIKCDPNGLLGTATQAGCGSVAGGLTPALGNTVLVDATDKGGSGCSPGGKAIFQMIPSATTGWRISALTIQGAAYDFYICNIGHINMSGGSHSFRIDNVTFHDGQAAGTYTNGDLWGVVDHVTFGARHQQLSVIGHSTWGGVGDYGDNSWAQPDTYGTIQQIVFENDVCNITVASGVNCTGNDGYGGRWTTRYSIVTSDGGHGTESPGRARGQRQMEMYANQVADAVGGVSQSGLGTMFSQRGGTALIFNNVGKTTLSANYAHAATMSNFRDVQNNFPNWGGCNGTQDGSLQTGKPPWDITDGVLYDSGNPSANFTDPNAGTPAVLTDSTKHWNTLFPSGLLGYSAYNTTQGWASVITSNTDTTITTGPDTSGGHLHSWSTSDTYNIRKAYPCIDQVGRGAGALVQNSTAVLASTGNPGPVNEVIDPDYMWSNTQNLSGTITSVYGFPNNVEGGNGHIQLLRDFYDDSPGGGVTTGTYSALPGTCTPYAGYWATDQNTLYQCTATNVWSLYYRPLVYPHPLDIPITQGLHLGQVQNGHGLKVPKVVNHVLHIGSFATPPPSPFLPTNWVNNLEYVGTTSNTITFPVTGTGGTWTCTGVGSFGPYTADSQTSLNQAIADAETCRTSGTGHPGTKINAPAGHVYSGSAGLTLPQTAGDLITYTNFIVLQSTTPLTTSRTVCSHGIQDNLASSTTPGIRNLGCNGSSMSYQLGTTITTIPPGAFTLANGTNTNTSAYNDIASMYTIEGTNAANSVIITGAADVNNVGPHHFAILNAEVRYNVAAYSSMNDILEFGDGTQTLTSQIPTHIHLAYSYIHGDWPDAPTSGGVATGSPNGVQLIPNAVRWGSCINCSFMWSYVDKLLRPAGEGHCWGGHMMQVIKVAHNWCEGASMGSLIGGKAGAYPITGFILGQDIEDRGNRYTYPYSWMLAKDSNFLPNSLMTTSADTGVGTGATINLETISGTAIATVRVVNGGSGYAVNDVLSALQPHNGSNGKLTVSAVSSGVITGVTVTTPGSGYKRDNYVRKNCHEVKGANRYLFDGNICENVDNSGAQGGQSMEWGDRNSAAGTWGDNYWITSQNVTITNNILRNDCVGPLIATRSIPVLSAGAGIANPPFNYLYSNNLLYNTSLSNPGCTGQSSAYGFRIGGQDGNGAQWTVNTATRDVTGTQVTLTLVSEDGGHQTDTNVGDPVQVSGCVDTTFNTTTTAMGPLALAGTDPNGLTIVYGNTGTPNATTTGCTFSNIQGYIRYLTFSHNTDVLDAGKEPNNATNCGSTPYMQARNVTMQNSLILNSTGFQSCWGEGTRSQVAVTDPATLNFNNIFIGGRGSITCGGGLTGAQCYTEYGGANPGASPPITVYLTPNSNCTTNDPVVESCAGVFGAMSTGSFPLALSDWHNYRLCHTGDAACNSKASIYSSGKSAQATDGTDLGIKPSSIDSAINSTRYCASCGSFPD